MENIRRELNNREEILMIKANEIKRVVKRLLNLLPDLEYSRQTHVIWRDCDQKYRDENPDIGDVDHHKQCIAEYDERITAIKEAVETIEVLTP